MTQMLVSQFSIHHYQSQPFEMAGIRLHDFHAEAVLQRRERNISNSPDAVPLDVVFNSVWCRFVMMIPSQPVVRDLYGFVVTETGDQGFDLACFKLMKSGDF